jgi:hypothetical protein
VCRYCYVCSLQHRARGSDEDSDWSGIEVEVEVVSPHSARDLMALAPGEGSRLLDALLSSPLPSLLLFQWAFAGLTLRLLGPDSDPPSLCPAGERSHSHNGGEERYVAVRGRSHAL